MIDQPLNIYSKLKKSIKLMKSLNKPLKTKLLSGESLTVS
jgi:hypothetical protein